MDTGQRREPLHEYVLLRFSQSLICTECHVRSRALKLSNAPVFDEHGCVDGIEAEVRYLHCGHIVDGAEADPVALAHMMNQMAEA